MRQKYKLFPNQFKIRSGHGSAVEDDISEIEIDGKRIGHLVVIIHTDADGSQRAVVNH